MTKPEGHILDEMKLENGLTIYFFDESKRIVGDRWQVQLSVHAPLAVKENYFLGCEDSGRAYEDFTAEFGRTIVFKQTKTRNFIADEEMKSLLDTMKEDMLKSNVPYLSNPSFAEKYVLKRYEEWRKEQQYRRAHFEAISRVDQ